MNLLASNLLPAGGAAGGARVATAKICALSLVLLGASCGDTPHTTVAIENHYPTGSAFVVYDAFWHSTSFRGSPLGPGESSDPQDSVPTSAATAYVVVAPGWDPTSGKAPTSLVVLQSRADYALRLNDSLRIAVDDTTFVGDCATGARLTQAQADFLTQRVFPADFVNVTYDAATCTLHPTGGAGAP